MANLYRLIFIVVVALFSGPTFADQCQAYRVVLGGWDSGPQSSPSLACAAMVGKSGEDIYTNWSVTSANLQSDTACVLKISTTWKYQPGRAEDAYRNVPVGGATVPCGCPVGKELVGSSCVCKAGLQEGPDGLCVPSDDTQCKTFYELGHVTGARFNQEYRLEGNISDGSVFCMPGQFDNENRGCKVVFDRQSYVDYGSGNSITEGRFDGKPGEAGLSCNVGDVETPAKPEEEKCPSGYTGTVNGVEVCVNKVPDSGFEPGSDETTVDDGQNTTTTRTNTETNCENRRCTTTTTVTTTVTNNASGGTTTTSTNTSTTQSQESFCKANPKAKLCGGSGLPNSDGGGTGGDGNGEEDPSSFTGACAGGFQCKGDAIQCAIAREQHIRACRLFDKESPESKLYEELKGKEGDQTKELPGNESIAIGDKINTTDALGAGGAGLSDLSITVWNQQVSLPLSMLNQYLAAMGNVLLAVSFLLAFRIVARG